MLHICTSGIKVYAQCPIITSPGGAGLATICNTSTMGVTTTGGYSSATETWSSSNTSVATITTAGPGAATVYGVGAGTAAITYYAGGSPECYDFVVTVETSVSPVVTGSDIVCIGSALTLTANPSPGMWSSSNTSIATVDPSGDVSGVAGGTVNITYTYTNSCGSFPATWPVTVDPNPGVITGPMAVCDGSTISLSDPTGDGGGGWQSSNTAVAIVDFSTGVVTGEGAGTAIISYNVGSMCGPLATATTTVEVDVPLTVDAITGTASVCVGATITLADATTGGSWSSSDATIATMDATGDVSGVAAGTATISYTATNSCGTYAATQVVTVNPLPYVGPVAASSAAVWVGGSIPLTEATTGGTWSSSSTSIATVDGSGNVWGVGAGTATITCTVTSGYGCAAFSSYNVPVQSPVSVDGITGTASVCVGATTLLADATTGGAWSSSNTSIAMVDASGNVSGVAAGTTAISYTVTNSCGSYNATPQIVTVNPLPDPGMLSGSPYEICYTDGVLLFTSGDHGGTWSSSTTTVATVESVGADVGLVYGAAGGTTTITYTVTSGFGCGTDEATQVITVDPTPDAGTITGTATVCAGASTALADAVAGGTWSSGNTYIATVSTGGDVYGVEAGTATITYTFTNACGSAHATRVVTVNPLADAGYIYGAFELCTGSSASLTDAATGGTWSPATGRIATVDPSGNLYGVAAGTATIISNGCGPEYATQVVTIDISPDAGTITGTATVCPGATTALADAAAGGTWSSDFTYIATVDASGNVTGVTSGVLIISYIVSNSCGSAAATLIVTVNSLPDPGTISGTGTICLGSTTALSDGVAGGTWSSSNTAVATINSSSGVATGSTVGAAIITYTVTNGCGSETTTYGVTVFTVNITVAGGESTPPVPAPGGKINTQVSLSSALANGVYILRLGSRGAVETYRVVVVR